MPFSFVVGITVVYLYSMPRWLLLKALVAIAGLGVLYATNIFTVMLAGLASLILVRPSILSAVNRYTFVGALLLVVIIVSAYLGQLLEIDTSMWARVGTYVVAMSMLFDGSWMAGIFPGVIDSSMPSNLANAIFDHGYTSYLSGMPLIISGELLERANYDTGGAFLPHNAALALISSHGFLFLLPALYYYLVLPCRFIFTADNATQDEVIIVGRILLFIVISSMLHPFILLIEIVFLGELIRSMLLEHSIDERDAGRIVSFPI